MLSKYGTVLVFKPEVSKTEVVEALGVLSDLLDNDYWVDGEPHVHEFDADEGGPIWYLP